MPVMDSMAVAARCVAVRAGAGAACSQSTTDPRLREALLEAMAGGLAASAALAALVDRTADIAYRQLATVDAAGGSASYSGDLALPEATGICAAGVAAVGNLLADRGAPEAMLDEALLVVAFAVMSAGVNRERWWRVFSRGAAGIALALSLAAIQWLPGLEAIRNSQRGSGVFAAGVGKDDRGVRRVDAEVAERLAASATSANPP